MQHSLPVYTEILTAGSIHNEVPFPAPLFVFLITLVILNELFGQQLLSILRAKDTVKGKVQLRTFGKLWLWSVQLVFTFFLFYSLHTHSVTLLTIFFLVAAAHGLYMVNILSTRVEITESRISYRTIFQSHIMEISLICKASWVVKGRSFGYTLVINSVSGKNIELSQIYFVGLNDLWKRFGNQ